MNEQGSRNGKRSISAGAYTASRRGFLKGVSEGSYRRGFPQGVPEGNPSQSSLGNVLLALSKIRLLLAPGLSKASGAARVGGNVCHLERLIVCSNDRSNYGEHRPKDRHKDSREESQGPSQGASQGQRGRWMASR